MSHFYLLFEGYRLLYCNRSCGMETVKLCFRQDNRELKWMIWSQGHFLGSIRWNCNLHAVIGWTLFSTSLSNLLPARLCQLHDIPTFHLCDHPFALNPHQTDVWESLIRRGGGKYAPQRKSAILAILLHSNHKKTQHGPLGRQKLTPIGSMTTHGPSMDPTGSM